MSPNPSVAVYAGEALARYGFGAGHPFGPDRFAAFFTALSSSPLLPAVRVLPPVAASTEALLRFHTGPYVERVRRQSLLGSGYLDYGDTPAFPGVFEAACYVVGSVLDAIAHIRAGELHRAFVPIAGLHHARRDSAAGFCVFNDCGIAIETLRAVHGLRRVAYVDIDAHHGDGVFYAFERDPDLCIADLHEDGRYLYPGTGSTGESGRGPALGTKLNVPLAPGTDDARFFEIWPEVERFVARSRPEFILLQCGADSLAGDPLTHLRLSPRAHAHAARRLCALADELCGGALVALGGGGYNRDNLAAGWLAVVGALTEGDPGSQVPPRPDPTER